MDRGVKFSLDRTDPNDTGFLVTAENVIREFARNALVKEQDTYRIHRLYELANGDAAHNTTHIVSAALTKTNAIATVSCFKWWFAAPVAILLTGVSVGIVESTQARNKLSRNTTFMVTISALAALIFFIGYLLQLDINI